MLVAAMNPCPCGYAGTPKCKCKANDILKYQQRLSGPIMDRIDMIVQVKPVDFLNIPKEAKSLSLAQRKEKVETARAIQRKRYKSFPSIHCNAQMTPQLASLYCELNSESITYLKQVQQRNV